MQYPTSFDDVVGQHDAKEALRVEISRAKRRAEPLPHLLLAGGPGLGKTLFAHVIAAEMGVGFRKISPGRLKPRDVHRVIFASPEMRDGDVLLVEEAHAAFAGGETPMAWLLDTLTDFTLLGHDIPRITVVLASHLGVKYASLKSRLQQIRLAPYSHAEAVELIAACTPELLALFPSLTPGQANSVARAGRRNPRQIRAILRQLEAVAGLTGDPATFRPEHYDLARALRLLGLSRDGLDALARDYLAALLISYGGLAGQTTMRAHLGEPGLDETEATLVEMGLLRRSPAGRELTPAGRRRAAGIVAGSRRHLNVAS